MSNRRLSFQTIGNDMKRAIALGALALGLAGCSDPARHQSTGFSGLGAEPGVAKASLVDPRLSGGVLRSDIPVKVVRSGSSNRAVQAELAIKTAKGSGNRSRKVSVGYQELALSIVYVNGTPYAVLKPKAGLFAANIVPETGAALASGAVELTGCPAISQVYSYGPQPNQPQGLTVALGCSA